MSAEPLQRARAGERDAFATLVGPYRRELHVHCYRMLGSLQDAEDALQETLLAAWLGLAGFEGRSSLRTWLYRTATNRCLNVLRASERPPTAGAGAPLPEPTRLGGAMWLQPYPDTLLEDLTDQAPGPEATYESREAISLAFVRSVQLLPPNQRAVLLLRDVLGYRAGRPPSCSGSPRTRSPALKRARATMGSARAPHPLLPPPGAPAEQALLDRFVAAFTELDVDALVSLMTDDVWVRMPPLPFEYCGTAAVHRFFRAIRARVGRVDHMVPVRANGGPAWGEYLRDPVTGGLHLAGVLVVELADDRICEFTRFESAVAPSFGLPRTLGQGLSFGSCRAPVPRGTAPRGVVVARQRSASTPPSALRCTAPDAAHRSNPIQTKDPNRGRPRRPGRSRGPWPRC